MEGFKAELVSFLKENLIERKGPLPEMILLMKEGDLITFCQGNADLTSFTFQSSWS